MLFQDMGFDAELVNLSYPKRYVKYCVGRVISPSASFKEWLLKYPVSARMMRFTRQKIKKSPLLVTGSTNKMVQFVNKQHYDAVVCGSDEIWRSTNREFAPPSIYFLPPEIQAKRLAFAPSANGTHIFSEKEREWVNNSLSGFSDICVRDTMTQRKIEDLTGISYRMVFDPTLAVDFPETALPKCLDKSKKKKICFIFGRPDNGLPRHLAEQLQHEDYELYSIFTCVRGTKFLPVSPEQFACVFQKFDLVFTNFFHGVIFSLKNGTPAFGIDTFEKYTDAKSKVEDLLERLGFSDLFYSFVGTSPEAAEQDLIKAAKEILSGQKKYDFSQSLAAARTAVEDNMKIAGTIINED